MTIPYDIARSWIGYNRVDNRDELDEFIKTYAGIDIDVESTAWCAAFANACLGKAGIEGTHAMNALSFKNWGTATDSPVKGDLVVMYRDGIDSGLGHVGFVDHFSDDGSEVYILGGNESNSVMIKPFNVDHVVHYASLSE